MRMRRTIIWIFGMLLGFQVAGQVDCSRIKYAYHELEDLYESGRFDEIRKYGSCAISIYRQLKTAGPKRDELLDLNFQKFLRLLIIVELQEGDPDNRASFFMRKLRELYPRTEVDRKEDPPAFIRLFEANALQVIHWAGISMGFHQSFAQPITRYETFVNLGNNILPDDFDGLRTFSFALNYQRGIGKHTTIGTELRFMNNKFRIVRDHVNFADRVPGAWRQRYAELHSLIDLPVYMVWRTPVRTPYGKRKDKVEERKRGWAFQRRKPEDGLGLFVFTGGGYVQYLFNQSAEVADFSVQDNGEAVNIRQRSIPGTIRRRQRISAGLQMELGYEFVLPELTIFAKVSGRLGLQNLRRENTRFREENINTVWDLQLADSDFRLHSVGLVGGVMIPLKYKVATEAKKTNRTRGN